MCPGDNSAPVGRERNHCGTPYTQNKRHRKIYRPAPGPSERCRRATDGSRRLNGLNAGSFQRGDEDRSPTLHQRRPARGTEAPFDTGRRKSQSAALDTATCTLGAVAPAVCFSTTRESSCLASSDRNAEALASKVVRSGRRAACALAAGSSKPSCAPFLTRCASSISSLSNRRQPSTAAKNRCMIKARTGS